MLARGTGTVLGISSIAGKTGAKYYTAYGASKHGLIGLMRSLAAEYARSGVTFNCVCPAYTDTAATHDTLVSIADQSGRDRAGVTRAALTPQGRLVQPEEVAALCVFLSGPGGRAINGQAINVDGGQVPC
jgi:NAD(P)-dependent dehydrogenase (short-subunit alcohol dehydrogenase family)